MAKAFKATWLGDGDPAMPTVEMGDLTFVKGVALDVPAGHPFAERIEGNPTFAIDEKDPELAPSNDPEPRDPDEGSAKGALKDQIRAYGGSVQGNASEETLRVKLAELIAKSKADSAK